MAVSLQDILTFWSTKASWSNADNFLPKLADILTKAKKLREENNYEALLIVHEYQHTLMTDAFPQLAKTIESTCRVVLRNGAAAFRSYLDREISEPVEWPKRTRRAFVKSYVDRRIVKAVAEWFDRAAGDVRELLVPLLEMEETANEIGRIEQDISLSMFRDKVDLMDDFERRISDLACLNQRIETVGAH